MLSKARSKTSQWKRSWTVESTRDDRAGHAKYLEDSSLPTRPPTVNVVLFGETGVGKSSVINLIARKEVAKVSSDVNGCTMQSTRYDIPFDGMNFAIFDTIGLEEPQMGVNGYLKAIEKAYELIVELGAAGGIHLLLFCMRGGRITATTQSNYRLFCECLCSKKVPVALVFTGLEREMEMEDWWRRNETHITHYGIKSDGHACITAVQDDTPGEDLKYTESQKKIRELLMSCALKNEAFSLEPHSWLARFGYLVRSLIKKQRVPGKRNVMRVLTQRCKLDPETARKIVDMMEREREEKTDGKNTTECEHRIQVPDGRGKSAVGKDDLGGVQTADNAEHGNRNNRLEGETGRGEKGSRNGKDRPQDSCSRMESKKPDKQAVKREGERMSKRGDRTNTNAPEESFDCADEDLAGYDTAIQPDDTEDEYHANWQGTKGNRERR